MIELTPFRAAALGLLAVAAVTLVISQSSALARRLDRHGSDESRAALRERFRGYTLGLVLIAIALVAISEMAR